MSLSNRLWTKLRHKLGIDTMREKYSYAEDPRYGKLAVILFTPNTPVSTTMSGSGPIPNQNW